MIIFGFFIILLILMLMIKLKFSMFLKIENFNSYFEFKFLFFRIAKKGRFISKKHENDSNKQKNAISKKSLFKKGTKTSNKRSKLKLLKLFIKNLYFQKLYVGESVGLLEPAITALSIPILSVITFMPLQFLKINYNNFKYEIVPMYEKCGINLIINSEISFRMIDFILSAIKIFHKKIT